MAGSMRTFVADRWRDGADFIGPAGGWAGPKKTKNSQVLIFLSWDCHFSMKVIYCASNSVGTKSISQGRRLLKKSAIFAKNRPKTAKF